jgi:hypothetical protein
MLTFLVLLFSTISLAILFQYVLQLMGRVSRGGISIGFYRLIEHLLFVMSVFATFFIGTSAPGTSWWKVLTAFTGWVIGFALFGRWYNPPKGQRRV